MGGALTKHVVNATKEDKGDAILAVHFIRGGMLTILYQQQGRVCQFIKLNEGACSEGFKKASF